MKLIYIVYILTAGMLFATCSDEVCEAELPAQRTVLFYLAGDNNLTDEVWQKIDSLTAGWRNTRDNLLIYQDSRGERGTPSLIRVVGDASYPYAEVVRTYPEANSASAEVFGRVVRDVLEGWPAPSCGLVVFSHGTGWLPEGSYMQPRRASGTLRSILQDCGREMELADFVAALPEHGFDFIVFEACLMAGVEVAYALREKADYLVASSAEILSPGFTEIYPALLGDLFVQPEADLTGFARRYFGHVNRKEGAYRSATVSVLRLDKMKALAHALQPVYALPKEVAVGEVQCFDRYRQKIFFDLEDYVRKRISVNHMFASAEMLHPVEEALQEAVAYRATTPSFVLQPIREHCGLTVYIEQPQYPELNHAYRQTSWFLAK